MAAKCKTKKMAGGGMVPRTDPKTSVNNGGRKNSSQLDPDFMNAGTIKRNGPSPKLAAAKRDAEEREITRQLNNQQATTAPASSDSYAKGGVVKKNKIKSNTKRKK